MAKNYQIFDYEDLTLEQFLMFCPTQQEIYKLKQEEKTGFTRSELLLYSIEQLMYSLRFQDLSNFKSILEQVDQQEEHQEMLEELKDFNIMDRYEK